MKASLVAYDIILHKKSELKIVNIWEYQRLHKIASNLNLVAKKFKG
jgi:hypothetical protein